MHSNSSVTFNGSNEEINGSVAAAGDFTITGSDQVIIDTCQAEHIHEYGENIRIGSRIRESAAVVAMMDFSEVIRAEAEAAGNAFHGSRTYNGCELDVSEPMYIDGDP